MMDLSLFWKLLTASASEQVTIGAVRWTVAILCVALLYIVSIWTRKRVAQGKPAILGGML